ncbi:MAG: proteasome subunit beta [Candidatus Nitrosocosmicus sp.]|jgi:proteasome beta subunit|uniref:proteasome subunit beta n=1 Tax=Candidatus Nitrosocosmicus agrestis TaxID=2563600 RepID=UPI00122E099F|nr:proteasome subunit beta [Candidatus Nitrosocosmicus sp. SS]KAA2283642.1 proteasome subunit beta [Candidatus Nitrosocosmicus sp. SS]KAF0869724.1 proteasome subunit beta [Candidatus Nitrosocosmicus sp. SS]MDR4490142.1 proteasome subunit beta [Candidatus Nitrosocosmicus sp.]HET6591257.1 proteasome subunit beta [Candidatus Nitrosocosmicus sp.]
MPGATAVGITYHDGVLLAAEKRISYGNFVVNKNTKKTFNVTEHVGAACAGMVADMQVLVRQVSALSKIRKLETRRNVEPNSVAKLMSVIMFERRYFPLLTQVVVGGVTTGKPEIYTLDPLGSVLPDRYAAVGTGAEMALGVLDAEFTENMDEEKAKDLALKSIKSSIQRDSASGDGIDLLIISKNGRSESSFPV